jgi:hypothetical protein
MHTPSNLIASQIVCDEVVGLLEKWRFIGGEKIEGDVQPCLCSERGIGRGYWGKNKRDEEWGGKLWNIGSSMWFEINYSLSYRDQSSISVVSIHRPGRV